MDLETANRLYEFRKKSGLSQEELADKLGLSRQAVSKWERAEASPDTDNLLALAKIYGVTLDELLTPNKKVEEVIKEADDEDKLIITDSGVTAISKGEKKVIVDDKGLHLSEKGPEHKVPAIIDAIMLLLVTITYIVLGFTLGTWATMWPLFLASFVPASLVKAIMKRRIKEFNIIFTATSIYCFIGMILGLWHPTWLVFLAIPVFYIIAKLIQPRSDEEDDEEDDDEKDEEEEKENSK